jgi:hypothetical protein
MPHADVELSVEIAARPETVFRCLTESTLLSRWLAAKCTIDPRVGGAVRIDFERYGTVVEGEVVELRPIAVAASASGSRVTLRHSGLPGEKSRRDHEFGWTGYLGQLGATAPAAQHPAGFEGLVDVYLAAWSETDAAARSRALSTVFLESGTFRDVHADVAGRAALDRHIAACQRMFPGVRLVRDGAVMQTRSSLLAKWNAVAGNGAAVASGVNHFRLAPGGEIAAVEGFWQGS